MRWCLAWLNLQQRARSACDLTGLGPSNAGRLGCVLILGAVLVGCLLIVCFQLGISTAVTITLAIGGLLLLLLTGATLMIFGSDDAISTRREHLLTSLPDAKAAWEAETERRRTKRERPNRFDEDEPSTEGALRPFYSKVVGITQTNADGSRRQRVAACCKQGEKLRLVREPDNHYDPNAVMVERLSGEQLGFLSRELADEIAPRLDRGSRVDVEVAQLTGGGLFSGKAYGVNIRITKYRLR